MRSLSFTVCIYPFIALKLSAAAPVCDLRVVPLPNSETQLKDYATTRLGMLFVATERRVFVYSPWGWDQLWSVTGNDKIKAIGVIRGVNDEVLLVGTEDSLWEISWSRGHPTSSPWAAFRYSFGSRAIEKQRRSGIRAIFRNDDEAAARGYVVEDSGHLLPIFAAAATTLGPPIPIPGAQPSAIWSAAPNGWSYAWGYRASTLLAIDPAGHVVSRIDLAPAVNAPPRQTPGIQNVVDDTTRNRIYVGTDFGVVSADLRPGSAAPAGSFYRIPALGLATIDAIAVVAGHLVVVQKESAKLLGKGPETNILIETGNEITRLPTSRFAAEVRFRSAAPLEMTGPHSVETATAVAPDVIWAESGGQLWQWTPESWTLLPMAPDSRGQEPSIFEMKRPFDRPLVTTDLQQSTLFSCSPPNNFWSRYSIEEGASLAALVPDPYGQGFWALEQAAGGSVDTYGYTRFLTVHGAFPTADGTQYSNHSFHIARLAHRLPGGRVYWPQSEHAGLLLPAGDKWLYGKGGAWRILDPGPGDVLTSVTPGANSSSSAWLGIQSVNDSDRVVRIDVSAQLDKVLTEPTSVTCRAPQTTELVPDDEGRVWLACRSTQDEWLFRRVARLSDSPDDEIRLPHLPDDPVYLFHLPLRRYVLTSHGYLEVPRSGQSQWIDLVPQKKDAESTLVFDSVAEPFARNQPSLPATLTLLTSRISGLPPSRSSAEPYLLNIAERTGSVSVIRDGTGATSALTGILSEASGLPAAFVWSPEGNGPAIIEWLKAQLGVRTESHTETLVEVGAPVSAARFSRLDFETTSSESPSVAITDGTRVAVRALPPNQNDFHAPLYIPTSLTFVDRSGKAIAFDLKQQFPPEALASTIASAALRVAPDYEDWWRSGPPPVEYRTMPNGQWQQVNSEGVATFPLAPGQAYQLEVRSPDTFYLGTLSLKSLPFKLNSEPVNVPLWVYPVSTTAVLVLLVAASRRARSEMLILLGRRWAFRTSECDFTASIRSFDHSVRVEINAAGSAEPREYLATALTTETWPPPIPVTEDIFPPGSNIRVRVDEALFLQPWAPFLGGPWSVGEIATIAGQIASLPPRLPRLPFLTKRLTATVLACPEPGRGFAPLTNVPAEVRSIRSQFEHWGAKTIVVSSAVAPDFLEALQSADVVHVAAHATLEGIEFNDRVVVAADLTEDLLRGLRCRLLVLSACLAGRIAYPTGSLVFELIRAGVNVLATLAEVDTVVCKAFLEEFYSALLPAKRARDISVARAIRSATVKCDARFSGFTHYDWAKDVNHFILYGDPTLHLAFRSSDKDVSYDSIELHAPKDKLAANRG